MPVRSSTSSVLRWPEPSTVVAAARAWAERERGQRPELVKLGVFGSYARGDAGVGSDLDLVAVVRETAVPFERRAAAWDLNPLPVPAEILVYTVAEWAVLHQRGDRFARMLASEAVWLAEAAET